MNLVHHHHHGHQMHDLSYFLKVKKRCFVVSFFLFLTSGLNKQTNMDDYDVVVVVVNCQWKFIQTSSNYLLWYIIIIIIIWWSCIHREYFISINNYYSTYQLTQLVGITKSLTSWTIVEREREKKKFDHYRLDIQWYLYSAAVFFLFGEDPVLTPCNLFFFLVCFRLKSIHQIKFRLTYH